MAQILVFGASTAYGVGGLAGGWPDLLKAKLHDKMYGTKEVPFEKHEVYNLCVPGATITEIKKRLQIEIDGYSKEGRKTIVAIELGGNDAKAIETRDNFVNTPENFYTQMKDLAEQATNLGAAVILVGLASVDESKTNPRINPNTGRIVYFTNERMQLFEKKIEQVAKDLNIRFVPVFEKSQEQKGKLLFDDGLHPSEEGHHWLLEQVSSALNDLL